MPYCVPIPCRAGFGKALASLGEGSEIRKVCTVKLLQDEGRIPKLVNVGEGGGLAR